MKLLYQLLLLAILPLAFGLGLTTWVGSRLCTDVMVDVELSRAALDLDRQGLRIEADFRERLAELRTMAASPLLRGGDPAVRLAYLRGERERLGKAIERLHWVAPEGPIYELTGEAVDVTGWGAAPFIERDGALVSPVAPDPRGGKLVIRVTVPVELADGRAGALGAVLPVEHYLEQVRGFPAGNGGTALLVDGHRRVALGGDLAGLPGPTPGPGVLPPDHPLREVIDALGRAPGSGPGRLILDGRGYRAYVRPVAAADWTLALVYPEELALVLARRVQRSALLVLALGLLGAVALALGLSRRLLARVRALQAAQERFDTDPAARAAIGGRDELGLLATSFDRMAERLERGAAERRELERRLERGRRLESLGVLAGGLAHDFNNLLAVILGGAEEALRDLPAGAPARAAVELVREASLRGEELTGALLAHAGRREGRRARVDLEVVVRRMLPLLRAAVPAGIELACRLEPGLHLVADRGQLQQVLLNLTLNAAESYPGPAGRVEIRTRSVALPGLEGAPPDLAPGAYAALEVEDEGQGMSPATVAQVFDPFFTTKPEGTGLGLPTVLGIVRAHGGAVQVRSHPGEGTRVRVLLPVAGAEPVAATPALPAWRGEGPVLVVDDEEPIRDLLARTLRPLGFEPTCAGDAAGALEVLPGRPLRLAVIDAVLPGLDGPALVRELRRRQPGLPVLLCSGDLSSGRARELEESGPTRMLPKPFRLAELEEAVRQLAEAPPPEAPGLT